MYVYIIGKDDDLGRQFTISTMKCVDRLEELFTTEECAHINWMLEDHDKGYGDEGYKGVLFIPFPDKFVMLGRHMNRLEDAYLGFTFCNWLKQPGGLTQMCQIWGLNEKTPTSP